MLAWVYMRANRYADAKRVAEAAIREGKDRWGTHVVLLQIAYAEQDAARVKTESEWGFTHGVTGQALVDLGFVAASEGKVHEAIDDFTRARAEAIRSGDADFADDATMFLAGVLEQDGYPREAAATLKQMQSDAYDPGTTAEFKAELGDVSAAQREISRMESDQNKSTMTVYFDLPMLRATVDLKTNKPAEAVKDLEPAQKYQMRDYGVPFMRARAEAAAGMLEDAAADYRLILANPGLDPIWPGHSLAHLYLAQVLARQKKADAARAEYRAFFALWKSGDPEVPVLIEAKQDYEKLMIAR